MEFGSVPVGRGRLTYWRRPGIGPTVVLLHGLGSDHGGLQPLVPHWPDVDVIAPDLPGHGRSSSLSQHTLPAYADAIAALCERLGLATVGLVGHSLGATIALTMAARHPGRVGSAVLLSPVTAATGLDTWATHAYYRLGAMLPARLARHWFLGRTVLRLSNRAAVRSADPDLRRRIDEADLRTASAVRPRVVVEAYHSIRRAPFASLARRVTAPTLVVGTAHDQLVPHRTLEALRDAMPHAELRLIADAGHLWPVEEPEAAAELCLPRFRPTTAPETLNPDARIAA